LQLAFLFYHSPPDGFQCRDKPFIEVVFYFQFDGFVSGNPGKEFGGFSDFKFGIGHAAGFSFGSIYPDHGDDI